MPEYESTQPFDPHQSPGSYAFPEAAFHVQAERNGRGYHLSMTETCQPGLVRFQVGNCCGFGFQLKKDPVPPFAILKEPTAGASVTAEIVSPKNLSRFDLIALEESKITPTKEWVKFLEYLLKVGLPTDVDGIVRRLLLEWWWSLNKESLRNQIKRLGVSSDRAEELVGDACKDILERGKMDRFDPHRASLTTFLRTVVRHFAIDRIRDGPQLPVGGEINNAPSDDLQADQKIVESERIELSRHDLSRLTERVRASLKRTVYPPSVRKALERLIEASEDMDQGKDLTQMARLIDNLLKYESYDVTNDQSQVKRKEILAYCIREVLGENPDEETRDSTTDLERKWDALWSPFPRQRPGNFPRWVKDFRFRIAGEYLVDCLSKMRPQWSGWNPHDPFPNRLLSILFDTNEKDRDQEECLRRAIRYLSDDATDGNHRRAFALCSIMGLTSEQAAASCLWEEHPDDQEVSEWNRAAVKTIVKKSWGKNA